MASSSTPTAAASFPASLLARGYRRACSSRVGRWARASSSVVISTSNNSTASSVARASSTTTVPTASPTDGRGVAVQRRRLAGHAVAGQLDHPPLWDRTDLCLADADRGELADPVQRRHHRSAAQLARRPRSAQPATTNLISISRPQDSVISTAEVSHERLTLRGGAPEPLNGPAPDTPSPCRPRGRRPRRPPAHNRRGPSPQPGLSDPCLSLYLVPEMVRDRRRPVRNNGTGSIGSGGVLGSR